MMPHPSFEIAYPSDRSNQLVKPIPHKPETLIITATKPEVVSTLLWYILLQQETFLLLLCQENSASEPLLAETLWMSFKILGDLSTQFLSIQKQSSQELW